MRRTLRQTHDFFFEGVSASGFGLMRIAWAFTVLLFLIGSSGDIVRHYSDAGILPQELGHLVFRSEYRFSLLQYITDPASVIALWWVFVVCLFCMMIGLWPRVMTVASVLLLFSFHERNLQPLGGGDTVLRNFGFILMIAPEISAFSVSRLREQWKHWKNHSAFLKPLKTHIWPYRLLLWQFLIIYLTSGWDKLQGTMWLDGTVVEAIVHHTHFARWPKEWMDALVWISPYVCFYTIIFEFAWLLMLVPKTMWYVLPQWIQKHSLKRWLIAGGLLFHWGIFGLMDVGSFPFALSTGFLGLLLDDDFAMFKAKANKHWTRINESTNARIIVLYDGICNICRRSIFFVQLADAYGRIQPVDFRNATDRKKYAAGIKEADLDRAMHIKMSSGRYFKGFDAFRKLTWHLPVLKIVTPFLYLPGGRPVGWMVYRKIAESRNRGAGGACVHRR